MEYESKMLAACGVLWGRQAYSLRYQVLLKIVIAFAPKQKPFTLDVTGSPLLLRPSRYHSTLTGWRSMALMWYAKWLPDRATKYIWNYLQ